ncbi:MAG: hypothetical protein EBX37_09460 [Alphaproteobacteria bacterium]|nr:hypothetical protein [Alphaproteobacteria bacterium]
MNLNYNLNHNLNKFNLKFNLYQNLLNFKRWIKLFMKLYTMMNRVTTNFKRCIPNKLSSTSNVYVINQTATHLNRW